MGIEQIDALEARISSQDIISAGEQKGVEQAEKLFEQKSQMFVAENKDFTDNYIVENRDKCEALCERMPDHMTAFFDKYLLNNA